MKYYRWALLFYVLLNLECKKHNSTPYAGIYHIRVPLLEANEQNSYVASDWSPGVPNVNSNREAWKFIPAEGKGYYIQSDSTGLMFTEQSNYLILLPDSAVSLDQQIFQVVPSPGNPYMVAFQSNATGKFVQVNYCYYGGETWGYEIPINDTSSCGAYGLITQSNRADTCYCVNQYVLEK